MKYDFLVVGAGFAGSVLAERIAAAGKRVLLIDKRNHTGGNCHDYTDEHGIIVHKYGPHIFHTNSKKVWDYVSCFTDWNIYFHKVLGVIDGIMVPVPFNLNSLYFVFSPDYAAKLEKLLIEKYGFGVKLPILKLKETKDKNLAFLADFIYRNVFLGYTVKQWGTKPEDLDFSVTSRIPVNISRDDRYFQDTYQGIPLKGYSAVFSKMLENENIEIWLDASFKEVKETIEYDRLIFTGMIDEYFDYEFGELPYRSLKFNIKTSERHEFQPAAQVNYPNNYDFTRITEFKHFLNYDKKVTTIAYEFPEAYIRKVNEPYYPVPAEANHLIYDKYKAKADLLKGKVFFTGRLAEYKYYNMDQVIGVALSVFENQILPIIK